MLTIILCNLKCQGIAKLDHFALKLTLRLHEPVVATFPDDEIHLCKNILQIFSPKIVEETITRNLLICITDKNESRLISTTSF
jgi:hypothetical protein